MWLPGSAAQAAKGKFAGARQASIADDTLLRRHPVHEALVDPMAEILAEDATTRNQKDKSLTGGGFLSPHALPPSFGLWVPHSSPCRLSLDINIKTGKGDTRRVQSLSSPMSLVMSAGIQLIQPIVTASNRLLQGRYWCCRHRPKD